jgi:uridine kinase
VSGYHELVRRLDELRQRDDRPRLVAVDGRSGVGKSTLAGELALRCGGAVICADDFYAGGSDAHWLSLPPATRAAAVIDWRRLRTAVLEPLLSGRSATWRPFDFERGHGLCSRTLSQPPVSVIVLDGAYSSRPELADIIDLSALVTLDDTVRRGRLLAREGEAFMARWHSIWDEAEDYYFSALRPPAAFDFLVRRY